MASGIRTMVSSEVIHSGNKHGAALYPLMCDIELTLPYFAFTLWQPNTQKGYEPSGTTVVSSFFVPCRQNIHFKSIPIRAVLERLITWLRSTLKLTNSSVESNKQLLWFRTSYDTHLETALSQITFFTDSLPFLGQFRFGPEEKRVYTFLP